MRSRDRSLYTSAQGAKTLMIDLAENSSTQYKGDLSHAFETAKITVCDPMVCKTPDARLQNELLY